jgi:DNA-binding response OmpR family regulator
MIEAREAGCDEFLAKPCAPEDLRIVVETMLRRDSA